LRIKVRFLSYLMEILGIKEQEIEAPDGINLGELVEIIKGKWPQLRKLDIESEGPIIVLLNGATAKLATKIKEGDEISILPPATGG